jgi:hypothetical protein
MFQVDAENEICQMQDQIGDVDNVRHHKTNKYNPILQLHTIMQEVLSHIRYWRKMNQAERIDNHNRYAWFRVCARLDHICPALFSCMNLIATALFMAPMCDY